MGKNRGHQANLPLKATTVIQKAMVQVGLTHLRKGLIIIV